MAELGEELLGGRAAVPDWLLRLRATQTLPLWVPDDYDGEDTISCDRCGRDTLPGEILTPGSSGEETDDRFCPDCWDDVWEWWRSGDSPDRR